jgi:hypothetical protein
LVGELCLDLAALLRSDERGLGGNERVHCGLDLSLEISDNGLDAEGISERQRVVSSNLGVGSRGGRCNLLGGGHKSIGGTTGVSLDGLPELLHGASDGLDSTGDVSSGIRARCADRARKGDRNGSGEFHFERRETF